MRLRYFTYGPFDRSGQNIRAYEVYRHSGSNIHSIIRYLDADTEVAQGAGWLEARHHKETSRLELALLGIDTSSCAAKARRT